VCRCPGAGALATVSLVQHRENQRYLALKKMDKKKILKMKQLEHIHNEKSLLEEVDHPFIVGLYESCSAHADAQQLFAARSYADQPAFRALVSSLCPLVADEQDGDVSGRGKHILGARVLPWW
jgi:serine/threonine protein kinase